MTCSICVTSERYISLTVCWVLRRNFHFYIYELVYWGRLGLNCFTAHFVKGL